MIAVCCCDVTLKKKKKPNSPSYAKSCPQKDRLYWKLFLVFFLGLTTVTGGPTVLKLGRKACQMIHWCWGLYEGIFHYLYFLTLVVKTRDPVSCAWLRFFPVLQSCHFLSWWKEAQCADNEMHLMIFSWHVFWILPQEALQAHSSFHVVTEDRYPIQVHTLTQCSGLRELAFCWFS